MSDKICDRCGKKYLFTEDNGYIYVDECSIIQELCVDCAVIGLGFKKNE